MYYSSNDQVIEEQNTAGQTINQYVWSPAGTNELVERDSDTNNDGTLDERLYALTDTNGSVTALVDTTGTVVERFVYNPYGNVTVLDGSFNSTSDSYNWVYMFQGGRYDQGTGLYLFDHRDYDPTTGTWLEQDPAGYVDSSILYQFVRSNPIDYVDPSGEALIINAGQMSRGASKPAKSGRFKTGQCCDVAYTSC
jgi:RHS repeat-associated protein